MYGKTEIAHVLKSDLNEVIFVLELWELLCKNIKNTTTCIFNKEFYPQRNEIILVFHLYYLFIHLECYCWIPNLDCNFT